MGEGGVTRREALRRLGYLGLGLSGGPALLAACGGDDDGASGPTPRSGATPSSSSNGAPPNIVVLIADDMRADYLEYMPEVRRLVQEPGVTFTQARCNVPLCQPSRVGLMTGQMSKHNNELGIGFRGTQLRDHDNCIGKWISNAGYRCGYFGKYVNFTDGRGGIDSPAGYATWREQIHADKGYDFSVHLEQGTEHITGTYSTDYLAEEASEFLAGAEPFMCIVAPTQPHAPPIPRTDLRTKYADLDWPIVDEVDVSDKPEWIQALAPLTAADKAQIREDARGALRESAAVDDMVRQIIEAMSDDLLANTVIVFTSDNGVHHGEHRRRGAATKAGPYEVGLRVPLLVRGPGFEPGSEVAVPSLVFQDLNATMLGLAGATAGLPHQPGISLVELYTAREQHQQRVLLHEIGQGFENQTGDGITTGPDHELGFRKLYRYPSVRSQEGGPYTYEAYDLDDDPDELASWADDPARRDQRDALEAQLDALLA